MSVLPIEAGSFTAATADGWIVDRVVPAEGFLEVPDPGEFLSNAEAFQMLGRLL